jgi:hypothetical protein
VLIGIWPPSDHHSEARDAGTFLSARSLDLLQIADADARYADTSMDVSSYLL